MRFSPAELAERRLFLGASEAAAAVGLSPWATPVDVYLDKIGQGTPIEESLPMKVGQALEPLCLELLEAENELTVTDRQRNVGDGFRRATLDGISSDKRLVEAKTSGGFADWGEGVEDIPQHYIIQVHHQFLVCPGFNRAYVPVVLGQRTFRVYEVQRSEETCQLLADLEDAFWQRVLDRTPPEPTNAADVVKLFPRDLGTKLVADQALENAIFALAKAKAKAKAAEEEAEALVDQVKIAMGGANALVSPRGGVLATFNTSEAHRIDVTRLRAENPSLAQTYTTVNPQRRLLIKVKP